MRRGTATWVAGAVALVSAAVAVGLSAELAGARSAERSAYARALAAREAQAEAAWAGYRPVDEGRRPAVNRRGAKTLCLRGAETPAAALSRVLGARVVGADRRVDVVALARLSRLAVATERAAPTRQRMGLRRAAGAEAEWEPVDTDGVCVPLVAHGERSRRAAGGAK